MKKATTKKSSSAGSAQKVSAPPQARLGTKRACPKCGTKFYDFEKEEITCPKCSTEIDVTKLAPPLRVQPQEPKKKPVEEAAVEALSGGEDSMESGPIMESVDDLGDDDGDVVEDIDVEEEEEEEAEDY